MKANSAFINIAVKNLEKSNHFFTELGLELMPDFSDKSGSCFKVAENIFLMVLTESKFNGFSQKKLVDSTQAREALFAFEVTGVDEVERLIKKVIELGGKTEDPVDYGFMYLRVFKDLDGHHFEIFTWKH